MLIILWLLTSWLLVLILLLEFDIGNDVCAVSVISYGLILMKFDGTDDINAW